MKAISWVKSMLAMPDEIRNLKGELRDLRQWRIRHLMKHQRQEMPKPHLFTRWYRRNRREG